jgi:rhamnose utilization protein RhaD (predicted bifunctional aldolase and dehydrogenase)
MAARRPGEEQKRPSVEALLHDILPFAFVVHTHPALVNGLTCSQRGAAAMKEIFGEKAVWIPSTNPGYILSRTVKTAMDSYTAAQGRPPAIIFLQNHGVFVGAETINGIEAAYVSIMEQIGARIKRRPDFSGESRETGAEAAEPCRVLAELAGGAAVFLRNHEIAALVKDRAAFAPLVSAFSPEHIVYAGSAPLFIDPPPGEAALRKAWQSHAAKTGRNPKIIALGGLGVCGAGPTEKAASLALDLFKDAVKVAVYAESFGGPRFMDADQIDFINNWEVERFRSSVSTK